MITLVPRRAPVVLTLVDYYLPGCKGGGPITTLANVVDRLGTEFDLRIATRDRDLGATCRYECVTDPADWQKVGHASVRYLPPGRGGRGELRQLLAETEADAVYLNSLYSFSYSILPLVWMRLGIIPRRPVVLAPRGELSPGARRIKRLKKHLFLCAAKSLDLHRGVIWQASTKYEERDIRAVFGERPEVHIAPDLTACRTLQRMPLEEVVRRSRPKEPGRLRLLFLGRICRMKNLRFSVEALAGLKGDVELHVVGPVEEPDYWNECRDLAARLPAGVRLTYGGVAKPADVVELMRAHDLLLLPTCGENFGHVVAEAMSVGTPVVISDRTPWRELADDSAGWDLKLERPDDFVHVLRHCVELDEAAHLTLRRGARRYWERHVADDAIAVEQNRELFSRALGASRRTSSEKIAA